MNPSPDQSVEYQVVAPVYDLLIAPLLEPEYRQVLTWARDIRAETVVDLCCGTGVLAERLADAGFTVTGVDLSGPMIRQARNKQHPHLTFVQADAASTGLGTGRFHLAIVSMALHEKPACLRNRILLEARRLVTSTGHILLIDYSRPTSLAGRFTRLGVQAIERLAGRQHHTHYQNFMTAGGLEGLIDRTQVRVHATHSFHRGLITVCLTSPTHTPAHHSRTRDKDMS